MRNGGRIRIDWHHTLAWATAGVLFLLPWQTRWIVGEVHLAGYETAFGILSVHATEVLVLIAGIAAIVLYRKRFYATFETLLWPGIIFADIVLVSTLVSQWPVIAWQHIGHIVVASMLFVLLRLQGMHAKRFAIAFASGLCIPVAIGAIQVVMGYFPASTLFGIAERLAERPGDAVVFMGGERVLRAYGSFSHPNIFGGYLSVAILLLVGLWEKGKSHAKTAVHVGMLALLTLGLFLTMSKSAVLGTLIALVVGMSAKALFGMSSWRKWRSAFLALAALALVSGLALAPRLAGNVLEHHSVSERLEQWQALPHVVAQGAGSLGWIVGSGPGAYVFTWQSVDATKDWWLYQPIHHVFALVLAEVGILGLGALLWILYRISKSIQAALPDRAALAGTMACISLLTVALVDHYLWSLWQGLVLTSFVLGVAWGKRV